jgi:hypothetical protein
VKQNKTKKGKKVKSSFSFVSGALLRNLMRQIDRWQLPMGSTILKSVLINGNLNMLYSFRKFKMYFTTMLVCSKEIDR